MRMATILALGGALAVVGGCASVSVVALDASDLADVADVDSTLVDRDSSDLADVPDVDSTPVDRDASDHTDVAGLDSTLVTCDASNDGCTLNPCGDHTCEAGEVCVHSTDISGMATITPLPGGGCPDGSVGVGIYCAELREGYSCSRLPVVCGGVTCSLTDASQGDGCGCWPSGSGLSCSCHGF